MDPDALQALLTLLKAPSKDVVIRLCNEAFLYRTESKIPEDVLKSVDTSLGVNRTQSEQLMQSLVKLVLAVIFHGYTDISDVISVFPADFHKNLKELLAKIFLEQLPKWREHALNNIVSLPRLVDFDWRVDLKVSSDSLSRMAVPTCLLQLKVEDNISEQGEGQHVKTVDVELSKEALDTMLDGLGKIRDQLNSVASRQTS